ncbi:MAG: P-loop NTPase fold protein [Bacteriovoracia bacterium]
MEQVAPDRPLDDPSQDQFDHAPFSKHLTNCIAEMNASQGMVIGIFGPWGSGKSTVIKFIEHYLANLDGSKQPIVTRFNPWLFSGQATLASKFLAHMQTVLKKTNAAKNVLEALSNIAFLTADSPVPHAWVMKWVGKLFSTVARSGGIEANKARVETYLKNQPKPIIVILDDVDRLANEEIRELFRLVKSVADFPNVIYLLAFDRAVVVDSLKDVQNGSGEEYLEKIIQIPFELPMPEKMAIRRSLTAKINTVLGELDDALADQNYTSSIYIDCIEPFIKKPRDIVRLVNTLSITYPAVKGEVNPVDFVAIETLRVFEPILYDLIRRNSSMFTGAAHRQSDRESKTMKLFHDAWLGTYPENEREKIKESLLKLFPKLMSVWGNTHYGNEWEEEWTVKLRVCSTKKFQIYFRLTTGENTISNREMKSYIEMAADLDAFSSLLLKLSSEKMSDGKSKVRLFLELMEYHVKNDVKEDHIENIISALFRTGDHIISNEKEHTQLFDFGIGINFSRLIWQLLKKISDREKRYEIIRKAIKNSPDAFEIIIDEVTDFSNEYGRVGGKKALPDEECILSLNDVMKLERCIGAMILAASKSHLLDSRKLFFILWVWRYLSGEEPVNDWISSVIDDDAKLVRFVTKGLTVSLSQGIGDYVVKKSPRLDPKVVEPFIDTNLVYQRLKKMDWEKLTENERTAVAQYCKEYDIRKSGKDPRWELP